MTDSSLKALDPEKSFWINASAGSGKTTLLVKRILSLLLNGCPADHFLCLTYTRNATAEISLRIKEELGRWATLPQGQPEDEGTETLYGVLKSLGTAPDEALCRRAQGLFQSVLNTPGGLPIQTIHGFCQSLLRRFALEAHTFPYFTVLDDMESRRILQELLNQSLTILSPDLVAAILKRFRSLEQIKKIQENILKNRRLFRPALVKKEETLRRELLDFFELDAPEADSPKEAAVFLSEHYDYFQDRRWRFPEGDGAVFQKAAAAQEVFFGQPTEENWQMFKKSLFSDKGEGAPRKMVFKVLEKAGGGAFFYEPLEALQDYRRRLENFTDTWLILQMAKRLSEAYEKRKTQQGFLDFDDFIYKGVYLLRESEETDWVRYALDPAIEHILVDEAQDTSPEQWAILQALYQEFFAGQGIDYPRPRTLFVVGDPKQSIYSFQGADFQSFRRQRAELKEFVTDIPQDISWRATRPLLAFVDAVFQNPEAREGVVEKNRTLRHHVQRQEKQGTVRLFEPFLKAANQKTSPATVDWKNLNQHAAEEIPNAQDRAIQCLGAAVKDLVRNQNVAAGDILILIRDRGDLPLKITHNLKEKDIPVSGADRLSLVNHPAVIDLLNLCRFVLLPEDDMSLAKVLVSPLGGWTADDLERFDSAAAEGGTKGISFWDKLRKSSMPLAQKAVKELRHIREIARYKGPYDFLSLLLREAAARRQKALSRLSVDTKEILQIFLDMAMLWSAQKTPSLGGFVQHMEDSAKIDHNRQIDMEKPAAVRIMTVHGSKGLQAPHVFVLDDMSRQPPQNLFTLYTAAAEKIHLPLYTGRAKNTMSLKVLKLLEEEKRRQQEEENRLLYVALTRPKDYLTIIGYSTKQAELDKISPDAWTKKAYRGMEHLQENESFVKQEIPAAGDLARATVFGFPAAAAFTAAPPQKTAAPQALPLWLQNAPAAFDPLSRPLRFQVPAVDRLSRPLHQWQDKAANISYALTKSLLQILPSLQAPSFKEALFILRQQTVAQDLAPEVLEALAQETLAFLRAHPFFAADDRQQDIQLSGVFQNRTLLLTPLWLFEDSQNRWALFLAPDPAGEGEDVAPVLRRQQEAAVGLLDQQTPPKDNHSFLLSLLPLRFLAQADSPRTLL